MTVGEMHKGIKMQRRDAFVNTVGDWLEAFPWQYFGTLTFAKQSITLWQAKHLFDDFVRRTDEAVFYFVVFENNQFAKAVHIHFLLGGTTERLDWRYGLSEIAEYDKTRNGRFYVSKFIKSGRVDWDVSSNLQQARSPIMKQKGITPLRAIRRKCLYDCCCGQRSEVRNCVIPECDLFPFRFGKNPRRKGVGGRRQGVRVESAS